MILKGRGFRSRAKQFFVLLLKRLTPKGVFYNTPDSFINFRVEVEMRPTWGTVKSVYTSSQRIEPLPEIFNYRITKRFSKYQNRIIPEAYIVILKNGKVYGKDTNLIISSNNTLSEDLSREFGVYGGGKIDKSKLFNQQLFYQKKMTINGKVAVISTKGLANFHHWNYDCMPRIHLMKIAGFLNEIDYFIIEHNDMPFQLESLKLLNIPPEKIIKTNGVDVLFKTETLFVPSLPSALGTVSPWVVDFLRNLYNPNNIKTEGYERIYISRKNVKSRHIIGNETFLNLLHKYHIKEVFPEDFTVAFFAGIISCAKFVISVHGSGLSNGCFLNMSTVVVDILAPYHQDAYYWQITNICGGRYIGFFGNGEHPHDDLDLVKRKIDDDIIIDFEKMEKLLKRELSLT